MIPFRSGLTLLALSLFVLGSNPACRLIAGSGSQQSGGAAQGGTTGPVRGNGVLNLLGGDPPTLDPAVTSDSTSSDYVVEIFGGLVMLDRDLKVIGDIAEKWDISADGKTFTFSLRKNAVFHDGKQVKASDFKWSWERVANPRTASPVADTYLGDIVGVRDMLRGRATSISGVRVVDDSTLQVTIDEPKPYFLAKLTFPTGYVLDKENVERGGRNWTDRPNGTGPFKLREWRRGQNIVLDRNERYHLGEVKLRTANFILSGGSVASMYENDEIDVAPVLLNDRERVLDPKSPLYAEVVKGADGKPGISKLSTFYVGFNVTKAPFDDPKIRQAIHMSIDKQKIVDVALQGAATMATTILPPGMPGYSSTLNTTKFDVARAKQLVAESKYPDLSRFDFVINTPGAGSTPGRQTSAMVEMIKTALGVDVKIEQVEWATFLDESHAKKYAFFELGWIADYPDPENFLDVKFHSKSENNETQYNNPQLDSLLERARTERDTAARLRLYQQAEQLLLDANVWIPMSHEREYTLVKKYVDGYMVTPMPIPHLRFVSVNK